ncbi:uncharacterized protein [Dermacentor albipictus]|uniref:uncharacterized protein n=1 Tax=Dermacentor albipictus TaxID=60249 RepID=UPI0038FC8E73
MLRRFDELERKQEEQLAKHDTTNGKLEDQALTIQSIEESLDLISSKYDEVLKTLETQNQEVKELKKKATDMEAQLIAKDTRLSQLEMEVNRMESYSRRNNLEIHGIKCHEREDLRAVINSLAGRLELPLPRNEEVEVVHSIKGKADAEAPILVRFTKRETREKWLAKRNMLKHENIYINENLTHLAKKLRWMAKRQATEKHYKYVWVRNGRIFVRKIEGAPVILVENEADLRKIT